MSAAENKQIVRRFIHEVINQGHSPDEFFADDFVFHGHAIPHPIDSEEWKRVFIRFPTAFPDFQVSISDLIAEGDRVVARVTARGTHLYAFEGIPPTHRAIAFSLIAICRLHEGKIAEMWIEGDYLGLQRQLGAGPA